MVALPRAALASRNAVHQRPLAPAGMSGPYTREKDPFVLWDLSRPAPVRDYARWFYNQVGWFVQ